MSNGNTPDTLPDDALGQYGSLLDAEEFSQSPQALPPAALLDPPQTQPSSLPGTMILDNLPAVATQGTPPAPLGSPGSCEAQSFAYGLGSYTAARNPDGTTKWDPSSNSEYQVSAAFMYRWVQSLQGREC